MVFWFIPVALIVADVILAVTTGEDSLGHISNAIIEPATGFNPGDWLDEHVWDPITDPIIEHVIDPIIETVSNVTSGGMDYDYFDSAFAGIYEWMDGATEWMNGATEWFDAAGEWMSSMSEWAQSVSEYLMIIVGLCVVLIVLGIWTLMSVKKVKR